MLLWLGPVRGKVIRMFRAGGRVRKLESSVLLGSNLKGMVPSRPVVLVAMCDFLRVVRRGRRKVEDQPAPRIR